VSVRRRSGIVAGVVVLVVAATVGWFIERSPHPAGSQTAPASTQPGPYPTGSGGGRYSVSTTSILVGGRPYLPYGVTIFGIAGQDWRTGTTQDQQQITAIAGFWRGNTVRIQVAPPLLASEGTAYLSAMRLEVSKARVLGLNVLLSAQYERMGAIPGPDAGTVAFWKAVAPLFASDPHVWFDLFNEPTEFTNPKSADVPSGASWSTWRNGGGGLVGMQELVDDIRSVAPNNLIFAEGLKGGKSLENIDGNLLAGSNIIYSVHPYFDPNNRLPSQWDARWGDLTSQIPILIGEWGQFETSRSSCAVDAPVLVPEFLAYVTTHHVGLIAWALSPGNMIRGTNLEDPTAFDPGVTYQCDHPNHSPDAQGAGAAIRTLFSSGN
jgi:hypothetical protein